MSHTHRTKIASSAVASCLALASACQTQEHDPSGPPPADAEESSGASEAGGDAVAAVTPEQGAYQGCSGQPFDPSELEILPLDEIEHILIRRLPEPTELGEDVAIHVRLPDLMLGDPDPQPNLLRVVGSVEAPILMFDSDALVELGHLDESPGKGFFTTFAHIDEESLLRRVKLEEALLSNGDLSEVSMIIEGRQPVALSVPETFDLEAFGEGALVRLGRARIQPVSFDDNWMESVFITDPGVVTDPERTYDTCTQEGNACGPWTFCHLMTEMANESRTGISPSAFAQQWLEQWLSSYTVNDDTVDPRTEMWTQIIEPWLVASGGQELDLEKAPFRLLAIVNRLDLRRTSAGGFGYGGKAGGDPLDAGELRFVFGVMRPDGSGAACEALPFTVIFEYGVPADGCLDVASWAQRWVGLDTMGGFGSSYRAELESMTETVVTRDAAPLRGNGSAINQIRTNEIALAKPWELREFTLTDQEIGCASFTDHPGDGFLRPHTVGQTPDDAIHAPTPSSVVDDFVSTIGCGSHTVPPGHDCAGDPVPLLGANSLASLVPGGAVPGAWLATSSGSDFVCRRHQFSVNTCNGCHTCDTATNFTHVDPMSGIPAQLSGFLLGTTVADTQFPSVGHSFADLDRRYQDLYQVAGAMCFPESPVDPKIFDVFDIDPIGPVVTDLGMLEEIFGARLDFSNLEPVTPVLEDFAGMAPPTH